MHPHDYGLVKIAYSVDELRRILPLGRTKIYEAIKAGLLKRVKIGRRTAILATDVAAFLSALRAEGGVQ
ncbi:MAG: helix-turn-helix domain-containing protein [Magnetospirillum sp.]|nr:helix-turn-helix domain-containing protein [Magnetospirillum sp.]